MEKYGFIYIWRDKKHNRYYIGSHWGFENDGYICSSKWMRNAFKLRPHDFKRRILAKVYTNRKDLLNLEFFWLSKINDSKIADKKYYNRSKHKNGHWSAEDYEKDIKKRISTKTKEAMQRPDVLEKLNEGYKRRDNRSSDEEVRKKRSESMKKTMSKKFPVENRRKELTPEQRYEYYSNKGKQAWIKRKANKYLKQETPIA